MNRHRLLQAVLIAAVSAAPLLYVYVQWSEVPAWVATHYHLGEADRWAPRETLWTVAWWPALAFVVFTCWPQVRGTAWFWRSARQRQVRAVAVAGLAVVALSIVYKSIHNGKVTTDFKPTAVR